ncbi:molybdenum cofactor guanylyltransferase MobA [Sneathiella chinensis]|uniref:Molybdenum cofactor guanylyltransferase n=1 Tax=Sneathiella chinensis TaxID=349750 RepID=A0ABQ5U0Y3_9PROT|nr:molybdenum cofactor guanylyltransferase MobA [Sneathiella chinensis]GLQ05820.1 molybdenum cofactor guanylyltransferase [Sneathiella chinensis]
MSKTDAKAITKADPVPCLLLAGGQSRRMGGGAKFLKTIGERSMLDHIIDRLKPQVGDFLINSNQPLENTEYPVRPDTVPGFNGPLAGILTGLECFSDQGCTASHMLSVPTDAPFLPTDLVKRLQDAMTASPTAIVMAYSGSRIHPVVALWPFALKEALREALVDEGLRKILVFAERYSLTSARWEDTPVDPFFNVNHPEDLDFARSVLTGGKG